VGIDFDSPVSIVVRDRNAVFYDVFYRPSFISNGWHFTVALRMQRKAGAQSYGSNKNEGKILHALILALQMLTRL